VPIKSLENVYELNDIYADEEPGNEPHEQAHFFSDQKIIRELTPQELDNRLFPIDEIGMPLTIFVPDEYWQGYQTDDHHHWAPKKKMRRKHGDMGKMLRVSRIQEVPVELHRKFNKHFEKTPLPKTKIGRFGHLLLAAARYLPEEAVDVRPEIPVIRRLSLDERKTIWSEQRIRIADAKKVQDLLLKHVTKQEIHGVEKDEIKEFLKTDSDDRRIQIGRKLFRLAAKAAVEPIGLAYLRAWDSGLLPRMDLRDQGDRYGIVQPKALPKEPHLFVARHLVPTEQVLHYTINALHTNLQKQQISDGLTAA
jgi:hypothetical protein